MSCCSCFSFIGGGGGSARVVSGDAASVRKSVSESLQKPNVKEGGIIHAKFIIDNPGNIQEFYEVNFKKEAKIGEGSYGAVTKGTNKATKAIRAVKTIQKKALKNTERFEAEIAIMKRMDHPNIIKLYESFGDARNVYLIMELSTGGELFDKIVSQGHFTEKEAAVVVQQIVKGIFYMHENHICHRDLKPENFLFQTTEKIEKNVLKIIDFGLSCVFQAGQVLKTKAGTPYYVAPQVLAGAYDQSCDVWSIGVIMYVMLCGYPPFFADSDAEVLQKVKGGRYNFPSDDWKNISKDAQNLIRELLKMEPKERYTAEQALNHIWIKEKAPKAEKGNLQAHMVDRLRNFRSANKLKKAALHVIAGQLSDDQIKELRRIFLTLDVNGDGLLSADEMKKGLQNAGIKNMPADLQGILDSIDADGSGCIDYTEFLAATLDKKAYLKEDVCWAAFRIFDKNGDGKISMEELQAVIDDGDVQNVAGTATLAQIMQDLDKNKDGVIDFQEFMEMMRTVGN